MRRGYLDIVVLTDHCMRVLLILLPANALLKTLNGMELHCVVVFSSCIIQCMYAWHGWNGIRLSACV